MPMSPVLQEVAVVQEATARAQRLEAVRKTDFDTASDLALNQ